MASEGGSGSALAVGQVSAAGVVKPPPWGWLIVADFVLADLWAGLFVVSALSNLIAHEAYGPVARIGYMLALPVLFADLCFLVADLGDPLRFHHMLRVVNFRSPMSTGMWMINISSVFVLGCFIIAAIAPSTPIPSLVLGGIGIAPAFFVGGYKGVMLSSTAQPHWKNFRWLGAEFASSAALLGVAGLLLVALFLPVPGAVEGMRRSQIALLFVAFALGAPQSARMLVRPAGATGLARYAGYLLTVAIEWIAPLVLSFIGGSAPLAASACLILFGAVLRRRELVELPRLPESDLEILAPAK